MSKPQDTPSHLNPDLAPSSSKESHAVFLQQLRGEGRDPKAPEALSPWSLKTS